MSATILVVDDEENARLHTSEFLTRKGYEVIGAATLTDAKDHVRKGSADIVLLDVWLPDGHGLELLDDIACMPMRPPVIVITGNGDIGMAVDAMKNGAMDFLEKPIAFTQLETSVIRALEIVEMRRELAHLRKAQSKDLDFIVGKSPLMVRAMDYAKRAALASVNLLICGPTGTGKDIMARAVHQMGPRASKPFVAVNCAAIQPTILETELFGYEAGAFTSAEKRKIGLMETADGGILFLDEISSMPVDLQAKLLRAIEEQAFRRVGGTNLIKVDVQVLSASNSDIPKLIEEGKFREDLYYRLKVVEVKMPSLKERKEDIPELVGLFIRSHNGPMGVNVTDVTPRAMEALMNYHWPGNIRELRNVIERAMLFTDTGIIDLDHLPPEIAQPK